MRYGVEKPVLHKQKGGLYAYNNFIINLGQAGSIFGPIGRIIGSELAALLGAQLDNAILGLDAEQKVCMERG